VAEPHGSVKREKRDKNRNLLKLERSAYKNLVSEHLSSET